LSNGEYGDVFRGWREMSRSLLNLRTE